MKLALAIFCFFSLFATSVNGQSNKNKLQLTEEKASVFLDDYFSFYNADYTFRNPKFRRLTNTVFLVSLEECNKKFKEDNFFWSSTVYKITLKSNNQYEIKSID